VKKLKEEINVASERIKNRQSEIELELVKLTSRIKSFTVWAWIFVIIGFIILVWAAIFYGYYFNQNEFSLNLLGDFLAGTVSSIWSLAGLFFIYVAFLGQKQQLLNQQLEIMFSQLEVKYTRLELAGQKEEMATQNATLIQQKFENTFFQLLANHNSIVNSLDIMTSRGGNRQTFAQGRDCFVTFHQRFKTKVGTNDNIINVLQKYNEFFQANVSDLGHYFRNLYHIIKFIDESEIENKKRYTNFVRAQLSSGELALLLYNCLSVFGHDKFKPLIEKYALLKNRDPSLLIHKAHEKGYKPNAFK
jgi:hypothetical protein